MKNIDLDKDVNEGLQDPGIHNHLLAKIDSNISALKPFIKLPGFESCFQR